MKSEQLQRVGSSPGFIAALDQSAASTPAVLAAYGIDASRYNSDADMFDLVHVMRSRIITSSSFDGDRVLGAILFEMTLDREVDGLPAAAHLWTRKKIVPFLKVDNGLDDEAGGVQLMQPNPGLSELLDRAREQSIFGTKMRSRITQAAVSGVEAVVEQQFDIALEILAAGLVPIIEPEVSIHCPEKAEAEALLREQIEVHLDRIPDGDQIMLKLTLPDAANFYASLVADPRVLRVAALSGGYSRDEANWRLAENESMIASFSRALAEGLSEGQTDDEFDRTLDDTVASIFEASVT